MTMTWTKFDEKGRVIGYRTDGDGFIETITLPQPSSTCTGAAEAYRTPGAVICREEWNDDDQVGQ